MSSLFGLRSTASLNAAMASTAYRRGERHHLPVLVVPERAPGGDVGGQGLADGGQLVRVAVQVRDVAVGEGQVRLFEQVAQSLEGVDLLGVGEPRVVDDDQERLDQGRGRDAGEDGEQADGVDALYRFGGVFQYDLDRVGNGLAHFARVLDLLLGDLPLVAGRDGQVGERLGPDHEVGHGVVGRGDLVLAGNRLAVVRRLGDGVGEVIGDDLDHLPVLGRDGGRLVRVGDPEGAGAHLVDLVLDAAGLDLGGFGNFGRVGGGDEEGTDTQGGKSRGPGHGTFTGKEGTGRPNAHNGRTGGVVGAGGRIIRAGYTPAGAESSKRPGGRPPSPPFNPANFTTLGGLETESQVLAN